MNHTHLSSHAIGMRVAGALAGLAALLAGALPALAGHPAAPGEPPVLHDGDQVCLDDPTGDVIRRDADSFEVTGYGDEPRIDVVGSCTAWDGEVTFDVTLDQPAAPGSVDGHDIVWEVTYPTSDGSSFQGTVQVLIWDGELTASSFSLEGTMCEAPVAYDGAGTYRTEGFGPECFDGATQLQAAVLVRSNDLEDSAPNPDAPLQPREATCLDPAQAGKVTADGREDWLSALNRYRAQAGLPPVEAYGPWRDGQLMHAAYLANHPEMQGFSAHQESEEHADYTDAGAQAASTSNIGFGDLDAVQSIEGWMQAPFHALGNLAPSLYASSYARAEGVSLLDTIRGRGWTPDCVSYPVLWPGDGSRQTVATHWGEWPDPVAGCPGYSAPTGVPIIVQPDPDTHPAPIDLSAHSLTASGRSVDHCAVTRETYTNPATFDQDYARSILDNAVLLIPREPLTRGATYDASVTIDGVRTDWSFTITPTWSRLAGSNRYATAATIATTHFPEGADTVYVATGGGFPDALAGAAAAARDGAPVLLTPSTRLADDTRAALVALAPTEVILLGGAAAVSDSVATAITSATGVTPARLSGSNRYSTAAAIANTFTTTGGTVYVATGANFPDALAGTAAAGAAGAPIVLTPSGSLPTAVRDALARLKPSQVIVLGGTSAVSAQVAASIEQLTGAEITRIAGSNRYDTAARIAKASFRWPAEAGFLATGRNFPDALAGAAVAGAQGAPILLTGPDTPPLETVVASYELSPDRLTVLGGGAAVSDEAVRILLYAMEPLSR